ncbi:MAG: hypothetical protein ACR2NP_07040 [Pirellulaceae bacterium]
MNSNPFQLPTFLALLMASIVLAIGGAALAAQECPVDDGSWFGCSVQQDDWVHRFNSPGLPWGDEGRALCRRLQQVCDGERWLDYGFAARGYYLNDQRIEFTGAEVTFGVEGVLRAEAGMRRGNKLALLYTELFLNQRFDRNILTDFALRESFAYNFEVDTLEISQLAIVSQTGDWTVEIGRFTTPFGRFYGLSARNQFVDVPFIRSEAILFRETGAQLRWDPGPLRCAVALTNGGPQQDTNSSKALVARVGMDLSRTSFGASVKWHDGIGSESQKEYKSHVGVDFMARIRPQLMFSTEVIYDEYGLRRPGFDLDDIFWGRSIYNRQLNKGLRQPLTGWGYYANLIGSHPRFDWQLSIGQFLPSDVLGDPIHDQITTRGIGQVFWHCNELLDFYATGLIENSVDNAQNGQRRESWMLASGLQIRF